MPRLLQAFSIRLEPNLQIRFSNRICNFGSQTEFAISVWDKPQRLQQHLHGDAPTPCKYMVSDTISSP